MKAISSKTLSMGFALFSMFFGAGNIIFPLAVGQYAGERNLFATLGLLITAAIMPILGVIAMILFDGDYKAFFGRLGRTPGFLLALLLISLLGPLGSTPRCIALSYTTLSATFPHLPFILFSALFCLVLFACTIKKRHILSLLGWVLTPLLLASLFAIIVIGLYFSGEAPANPHSAAKMFWYGIKEGYNTMDLLAAFFFSSSILALLRLEEPQHGKARRRLTATLASLIGCFLLSLVYIGFSHIASFHAQEIQIETKDELISAIILKLAGDRAGLLVCLTVVLACLTTAIALIAAFADFFQKEVFQNKVRYELIIIGSLLITFIISTFKFSGIAAFLGPLLQILYPGLILLTLLNIFYKWKDFQPVKIPVFATFLLSFLVYFVVA